jgi:hypothetical protein
MVPVIVNSVLNEHQVVIDIVSFVLKGDFHRSRLGEKQRGKILAGWVTRKMRTIAQYSIRDPNGPDNQITEVAEPGGMPGRTSTGTFRGPGSVKGSLRGSLLGVSTQLQNMQLQTGTQDMSSQQALDFGFRPNVSEMPSQGYPESIPERAELPTGSPRDGSDDTPTEAPKGFPHQLSDDGVMGYHPIGRDDVFDDTQNGRTSNHQQYGASGLSTSPLPAILQPGMSDDRTGPPEPHYGNKPFLNMAEEQQHQYQQQYESQVGDRWELPSQRQQQQQPPPNTGGGLRITNRDSTDNDGWAQEAIMHMNFAGAGPDEMRRFS